MQKRLIYLRYQFYFVLASILLLSCKSEVDTLPPYKNADLVVDLRVKDLLSRMTLEEKVAQLTSLDEYRLDRYDSILVLDEQGNFTSVFKERLKHGIGEFSRPAGNLLRLDRPSYRSKPSEVAKFTNQLQKYVLENTRLGIPIMFHEEALHGLASVDATVFPQAISLASTWEPALIQDVFSCVAKEVRAIGAQHALTPVLDIARDLRWGRVEETYGEDPFLAGEIGVACIKGFQGGTTQIDGDHIIATLKHFAVHGQPEGGLNIAPGNYSERVIREQFLPPFERAVREAGALSIMAAYSEVDGIPCHANHWLLKDVLRNEWGFNGMVISDYEGINKLKSDHRIVNDLSEAAKTALEAGVDLELPSSMCYPLLAELVANGSVDEKIIDQSVARILRMKFLTGLFENPYVDEAKADNILGNEKHAELALEAARKSIILLKNDKELLPLQTDKYKTIAVIGPNAAPCVLGGYSGKPRTEVGLLEGLKLKIGDKVNVSYAKGCEITIPNPTNRKKPSLTSIEIDNALIAEAVAVARKADIVILAVGGNEHDTSEGGDRNSLQFVGNQDKLVKAIYETKVPVVAVLINGRPITDTFLAEKIPAILECWYGGQHSGTAIAEVLFGAVNPGGKLPLTIPRSVGDLPSYYYKKPSQNRAYLFSDNSPLYPFGYGLSYTTFQFDKLMLSKSEMDRNDSTVVSINITNTGKVTGDEVVQLYIRDVVSSVTRPIKELKGFKRLTLKPGQTETCSFSITPDQLSFLDGNMKKIVEPGIFQIMVGNSSMSLDTIELKVR